jgi:hypothetical protein
MRKSLLTTLTFVVTAASAHAEASKAKITGPEGPQASIYQFDLMGFAREEWTKRQYLDVPDDKRWQLRLFPSIEIGKKWIFAGVGGDLAYGQKDNVDGTTLNGTYVEYAENYHTRSARLDLAYLRLIPMDWLRVEGGRIKMPVPLTEMLWDADLKPQGGAVTLDLKMKGELSRLTFTGLAARGSHPFRDEKTNMVLLSATGEIKGGPQSVLAFSGSVLQYTDYNHPGALDPRLFRENTRAGDGLASDFRIVDLQARLRSSGQAPGEIVFDYCINTKAQENRQGVWLAVVLGALPRSRARIEYVYARIDRDATLGAYNTDDFVWHTDWVGHRLEIATGTGRSSSLHVIGELQHPRLVTQSDGTQPWVRRIRIEWRIHTSS